MNDGMQKLIFLGSALLINSYVIFALRADVPVSSYQFKSKDNALNFITSVHTKVFGKQNLITERITVNEGGDWFSLLKGIEDYTQRNDKDFLPYVKKIREASLNFINGLKIMYHRFISPALKDPKDRERGVGQLSEDKIDLKKIDLDGIKNSIAYFKGIKNKLTDIEKSLNRKILFSSGSRNAREVLLRLILVLKVTIDKVFIDYEKLKIFKIRGIFGSKFLGSLEKLIPNRKK